MENEIIDIHIDFLNKKINFITKDKEYINDLNGIINLNEDLKLSKNHLYNVSQLIKDEILYEFKKLIQCSVNNDSSKFDNVLMELIKKDFFRDNFLTQLRGKGFLDDIINNKFYSEKNYENVKNSFFFKRFLSKEDYSFCTNVEYDEFNEFLSYLHKNYFTTIIFCEINNLKVINNLISYESGDEIINSFIELVSENFPDCLLIRQSGDEFIILANASVCSEIISLFEEESFLSSINNSLPMYETNDGVSVFSTISCGKAILEIPSRVYSSESIIHFKKRFNISYCTAQNDSFEKKKILKNKFSHDSLEIINSKIEIEKMIKYQQYKNSNNIDYANSNNKIQNLMGKNSFLVNLSNLKSSFNNEDNL